VGHIGAVLSRQRLVVLLMAATVLAYVNAFHGAFQFDDATILSDSRLGNPAAFVSHLGGMIRPALKLTFLLDRSLWGESAAGYHLLNLLLHLGSGLLLYAIVRGLLREGLAHARMASARTVPLWTALLFLLHPIGTETVTYISGRATGLMAFFYLAGIYLYLRSTGPRSAPAVPWAYFAAIGCFLLSLLSKETAVTFPLSLLLIEAVGRGRNGTDLRRAVLRFHWPFWGILVAFLAAAASYPRYVYLLKVSFGIRPIYENLLTQVDVVAYALSLFFLPGRLNSEHDIPLAGSIFAWPTPLALLLLVGLFALAVFLARRNRLASFGLFWFFLQLLPTNSVLPRYDLLSERDLYLAAPGLFLALAAAWSAVLTFLAGTPASRGARIGVFALRTLPLMLVPLLAVTTFARNAVYATPIAFWSDATRKSPAKARPHVNLSHAYYVAGDFDRAIAEARMALAIDRNNPVAQANLLAAWRRKTETTEVR
jgi:tetratricopeptide (TPR) repeat protein